MAIYTVAFSGKAGTNTANTYIADLWTPTRKARVIEVGCFIQTVTSTAPLFALARSSVRGTSLTSLTPISYDPGEIAATAALDTTSTSPTFASSTPMIVGAVALAAGNGVIWNFDPPIEIAIAAGLMLFNVNASGATTGTFAGYFKYDE